MRESSPAPGPRETTRPKGGVGCSRLVGPAPQNVAHQSPRCQPPAEPRGERGRRTPSRSGALSRAGGGEPSRAPRADSRAQGEHAHRRGVFRTSPGSSMPGRPSAGEASRATGRGRLEAAREARFRAAARGVGAGVIRICCAARRRVGHGSSPSRRSAGFGTPWGRG